MKYRIPLSDLAWNDYIAIVIILMVGVLIGMQMKVNFVTESVIQQCNDFIIEKYENVEERGMPNIIDPEFLLNNGTYERGLW